MRGDSLVSRLWNWGAFARQDEDRPDNSCANPIYEQWIPHKAWDSGWGDTYPTESSAAPGPDEIDAEIMDGWIRQLPCQHKCIVGRRFRDQRPVGHELLDAALDCLEILMAANRQTVAEMRRLGAG